MKFSNVPFIDQVGIHDKKVLMRVDFNVSLKKDRTIEDDVRIQQSLPSIQYLLNNKNKLILMSHLGRPKERDPKYSLDVVAKKLHDYLPHYTITVVEDFLSDRSLIENQKENEIILLENIRFYPEEKKNDVSFAKELASLGDVFVNDGFGVSHRTSASVVGVTKHLPSYAGLLMKKEILGIGAVVDNPKKPLVAILGGSKISSKIHLIERLIEIADNVILGGGIANTFMHASGYEIGKSIAETDEVEHAKRMLFHAVQKQTRIIFPSDVVISSSMNGGATEVVKIEDVPKNKFILDIGSETQAVIGSVIASASTIVWNGPVGYFENSAFRRGTDFLYYSITENTHATSVVGGGDTLAAIAKKEYLEKITHISTGGGAMLEFIEKGTLPGIEALRNNTVI
ncbi:MAG: phosphoglycerate kinase [Patescibacteria group bacterium]